MSLLILGVKRFKALVLMLVVTLTISTLFGISPASATADVTVTPGEPQCPALFRTVTNNTSGQLYVMTYVIINGQRTDYSWVRTVAPGESAVANTMGQYYSQSLGVKTGRYVFQSDTAPTLEWTDWGATEYVMPSGCPPLVAPARLSNRTKLSFKSSRPVIYFKSTAYVTEFGYSIGKKAIRWSSYPYDDGLNFARGPLMKPGQRLTLKLFSRNRDDSDSRTDPVLMGKKTFRRLS